MTPLTLDALNGFFTSPHDAPPKWLCVLMHTAYIDETGQTTDGWIFLTGWFGNEEHWKAFMPKWKAELGNRANLHMCKLRWGEKNRRTQDLLARLGPIPSSCGLRAAVGGLKYSDYRDLVEGSVVEKIASGYVQCLYPLVSAIVQHVPGDERVELLFGAQETFQEKALETLNFISRSYAGDPLYCTSTGILKLAKFSFAAPGENSILYNPSDYLASALAHHKHDKYSRKARWSRPILDATQLLGRIYDRDEIRADMVRGQRKIEARNIPFFR